jgi:hypothetical protein
MLSRIAIVSGLRALAALCAVVVMTSAADAAELVMFRSASCPWCARWDREIGSIYPKTDIGQRLPLRMVNLDRGGDPTIRIREPIHYTPTFVLVEKGEEQGRIEGYAGDAFFWGLLERLEKKLPVPRPDGAPPPGATRAGADTKGRIL